MSFDSSRLTRFAGRAKRIKGSLAALAASALDPLVLTCAGEATTPFEERVLISKRRRPSVGIGQL